MWKIINGKQYNTDTAEKIRTFVAPKAIGDHKVSYSLYKKGNGEYFQVCTDETQGKKHVTLAPLTNKLAENWDRLHAVAFRNVQ